MSTPVPPPDECGLPMFAFGPTPRCTMPAGHVVTDGTLTSGHREALDSELSWTRTFCGRSHEPGTRCLLPDGHAGLPSPDDDAFAVGLRDAVASAMGPEATREALGLSWEELAVGLWSERSTLSDRLAVVTRERDEAARDANRAILGHQAFMQALAEALDVPWSSPEMFGNTRHPEEADLIRWAGETRAQALRSRAALARVEALCDDLAATCDAYGCTYPDCPWLRLRAALAGDGDTDA